MYGFKPLYHAGSKGGAISPPFFFNVNILTASEWDYDEPVGNSIKGK